MRDATHRRNRPWRNSRGQATIEWVALLLVVAVAVAVSGAAVAGAAAPADGGIGKRIAQRIACAADLRFAACLDAEPQLVRAYGPALAETVRTIVPTIEYEEGMAALPVDFRDCRSGRCSIGPQRGRVGRSDAGLPVTLFTRLIDCREGVETAGADCSGGRAGNVYIVFWSYFTGSATGEGRLFPRQIRTVSKKLGVPTYHRDDFEQFAVRLDGRQLDELGRLGHGADPVRARSRPRAVARVSSHKGFAYAAGDPGRLIHDSRADRTAWGPDLGRYGIYGGSHAGYIQARDSFIRSQLNRPAVLRKGMKVLARLGLGPGGRVTYRYTPARDVRLVPLEFLAGKSGDWRFEVTPPWEKPGWTDGETTRTG